MDLRYALGADRVATITMSAPDDAAPALTPEAVVALDAALERAEADAARVVLLAATGDAFSSGLALAERFGAGGGGVEPDTIARFARVLDRLGAGPAASIAVVHAPATGGGVGLAAACDLVVASERASFSLPEVVLGLIPALIGPALLRRLSPGRAAALALSTRRWTASEAQAAGLVDEVLPPEGFAAGVERQVQRLLRSSPEAVAETKRYLRRLAALPVEAQSPASVAALSGWLARPEVLAALAAYAEGEAPPWFARRARGE